MYRVHDLPFMVRQSVPRTALSQHARRDALSSHHCPSVALELLRLLLSLKREYQIFHLRLRLLSALRTHDSLSCLQQAIIILHPFVY